MSRVWLAGLLAAGMIGAVPAAVAAFTDDEAPAGQGAARPQRDDMHKGHGFGPPPWAHHGWHRDKGQGEATWKQAWRDLTPEQREQKMSELAKAHADGMAAWKKCTKAAGPDRQARAACEKPWPPGLAKRQP